MQLADRKAGFPSFSVVMTCDQRTNYALVKASDFDVVASEKGVAWDKRHLFCLEHLFWNGDIWSTSFSWFFSTGQPWLNELLLNVIKLAGIRIIAYPLGADVAFHDHYRDRYDTMGRIQRDYPDWDLVEWGKVTQPRVSAFCNVANLVIGMDSSLSRFLPRNDLFCKPFCFDTNEFVVNPSLQNQTPLIVHATNHRFVKGTDVLLSAVEELQLRGFECQLRIVEKVARLEAMKIYGKADIIADQFIQGAYGVFAMEAMALGKPVLTYLDQIHLANPVFSCPIVNTTHENMLEVLAVLVTVPLLRERLGAAGRECIELYYSPKAIGEIWKQAYEHVWWGTPLDLDQTAHFGRERQPRAFTEDPADIEFWPVPVDDLLPQIRHALDLIRRPVNHGQASSSMTPS
jgi:hypothetical protein